MIEPSEPAFAALLEPHRSLGRRGFAVLMTAVAAVGFAVGMGFVLIGAWPVFAFFGLDVALIWIAFKASYRNGRMHETLHLTPARLTVERIGPGRRRGAWRFQPHWLRVEIEEPPGRRSRLTLASHGRRLEIGAFLAPAERTEVALALRVALAGLREPARGTA